MLENGGKVNFLALFELDRALESYANILYEYMDYNGKTTKEEEDWEIPGTLVSSVILTALKVLRMKRAITFLRVSTKLFRQTFPKPAVTAAPVAAPAGDRADEADVAGQPHTVLRPRQTNDLNDDLAKFGGKFRATARITENLRDDPEQRRQGRFCHRD